MDDMNKIRDLLGSRVIDEDEHKGTVLFHGIVQGYKGTWLGIDWDEATRGKHDGTVNNIAYFTSKSPTSGSFVRPNKMHFGISLMKAVRERYGQVDMSDLPVGCMIGNKEIELVGMEKSLNKTKDASKLLCIVLDGLRVSETGVIGDELKCCREIDLNNNVLYDWNQVLAILKQVNRLNFMNISKNLINNLRSGNHEKCVFPNLETFLMHYADLDWEDVCIILEHLPGIRDLGVSHNRISHLSISSQNLDNLAILDLEANPIKCWNNLKALFTLPKLVSLNLNESQISEVKYVSGSFPALKILFLRNCLLTSWQSLAELSKLGSLEHLLVHGNPIITAQSIATSKQIVIATMPRLLILDREHKMAKRVHSYLHERLISLVQSNSCLWDSHLESFRNNKDKAILWQKISDHLNFYLKQDDKEVTDTDVKETWRYYREAFRTKFNDEQIQLLKSGGPGKKRGKDWPWMKTLSFLQKTMTHSETESNLTFTPTSNRGACSFRSMPQLCIQTENNEAIMSRNESIMSQYIEEPELDALSSATDGDTEDDSRFDWNGASSTGEDSSAGSSRAKSAPLQIGPSYAPSPSSTPLPQSVPITRYVPSLNPPIEDTPQPRVKKRKNRVNVDLDKEDRELDALKEMVQSVLENPNSTDTSPKNWIDNLGDSLVSTLKLVRKDKQAEYAKKAYVLISEMAIDIIMRVLHTKISAQKRKICVLLLIEIARRKLRIRKAKCNKKRSFSVRLINRCRDKQGAYATNLKDLRAHDADWHFNYLRMSKERFDHLVGLIEHKLIRMNTCSQPITPAHQLAVTLRYLATGCSFRELVFPFRLGESTVPNIVYRTCKALWDVLAPTYIKFPQTENEWKEISNKFWLKWNFPLCLGALDGKHIRIQAPHNCGSAYFNHKGFNSMVLLAMCDADYKFTYIDLGGYGRNSDAGLFGTCSMGIALNSETNVLNLPEDEALPGTDILSPYTFIGDEGFSFKRNLMRPYPGRSKGNLSFAKNVFNYRLSRARRIIENSFGILAARFRIFRREIQTKPSNARTITKACLALHNYLITESAKEYAPTAMLDRETADGDWIQGGYRDITGSDKCMDHLSVGGSRAKQDAYCVRDKLAEYFQSDAGKVSWQEKAVTVTLQ